MEGVEVAPTHSHRLRFDQFVIDSVDERVIGPNGPVRIGNKAFRVISALAANEGRLLTKDALFETVWDGTYVSESALTSVIKELRRALGDDSRNPRMIESVYGRGYRLISEVTIDDNPGPGVYMGRQPLDFVARTDAPIAPVGKQTELSGKPSIAVVPLLELGETSEDWFADAIAEEIIASLSQFRDFFVISSITSLSERNRNRDVREISSELGVRYVMSGSIQRAADRVRIIARLEDGIDNRVVWSDKFNEKIDDIFDLQDRIAMSVASRIGFSINDAEAHRAKYRPSSNLRDLFWQANLLIRRIEPSSIAAALGLAERALEIEPDDPWAASIAAVASAFQFLNGWTADRAASRARAIAFCERALSNPKNDDDRVLGFCGLALASTGHNIELASQLTDRAIDLNPSNATSLFWGSWIDVTVGNAERAMERADTSLLLNPMSNIRHLVAIPQSVAMIQLGHYAAAAENLRKVVEVSPQGDALAALIIALVQLGEMDEARSTNARLKAIGGAIGGLALMRKPEHRKLVEDSLARAAA